MAQSVTPTPQDPDLLILASVAASLVSLYSGRGGAWTGSPFAWIIALPSRQVGKIGEQLVAGWCASRGLRVVPSRDAQADLLINSKRVEVKFSTLWAGGDYVFQQIRNQQYELVLFLGLSPFKASCWVVPKEVILTLPLKAGLRYQHGGQAGRDTIWLRFAAETPPSWLRRYGGTLENAYRLLSA